jgi:hypothetical protein
MLPESDFADKLTNTPMIFLSRNGILREKGSKRKSQKVS